MRIKDKQERGKISILLPIELDRRLRHQAIDENCTCSEVVENALIAYFQLQDNSIKTEAINMEES
ncbi:hypothetical protein [Synechococcus sp. PCC 6312]|uniref:hypothetical protein n=1 Tax=Synechococcus sp. (strain ATCC 27167 / PCC 6312) TaxID=195253 RepID=UPI00029F33A7|nr:hypothetical protein [Synechococcus sp. PCC 6312]AFY60085.1 hypothetical protein Syn6312_0877 [Synechococcus sp. PCC 6312]